MFHVPGFSDGPKGREEILKMRLSGNTTAKSLTVALII